MWFRIAGEITEPRSPASRPRRGARWLVAAAVVGGLVGGGATALVVDATETSRATMRGTQEKVVARADLAVPSGTGTASGTANLIAEAGRWTLVVDTRGLVADGGYFEVWLLDSAGRMYALGVLPEGSTARLAVPSDISVKQFDVVDISAQEFNGDPSHSTQSVLRGTLRE